jgi:hypothetical protein
VIELGRGGGDGETTSTGQGDGETTSTGQGDGETTSTGQGDIFSQRKGISWLAEEREQHGEVDHSSAIHVREDQPFILKSPNPLVISSTAASVTGALP